MPRVMTCDKPNTLFVIVLTLLKNDPRSTEEIALHSGVPYHWLYMLTQGRINKPGVNRMQHLYEYLSGQPLRVEFPRKKAA